MPVYWLPTFSPQRPLCQSRLASLRNRGLDGQLAARAHLAQRRRTRRATAALCRRRAGRYPSVGQAGCAEHGLLRAHAPRLARVRPAARCAFRAGALARVERPVWTPQAKWQARRGWRRVPLTVRGREVRLLVTVAGAFRRVGWGKRVFFVLVVDQAGQIARADLGSRGCGRQGGLAVACAVGAVAAEVVAALGGGGGVSVDNDNTHDK